MSPSPVCGDCGRVFTSFQARAQHMNALGHDIPDNECDTCDRYFGSREAVFQHMNAFDHWRREIFQDARCNFCGGLFGDEEEVEKHEHLRSSVHCGINLPCPFCQKRFVTATGVTHHLESGGCPNAPLDRQKIYRAIASFDRRGNFTKKLIGYHGSAQYETNDMAYNHDAGAWECYICHRRFDRQNSLDQHLNSPAHQQALYHCPKPQCPKEFNTAAGLCNHLESETCGMMRFGEVQKQFQAMLDPSRLLNF
ncbi:hypothetical protein ACHAQA_003612 [Verticillium albo-atrum]